MENEFQKLNRELVETGLSPQSRKAREWFASKAREMTRVNRERLIADDPVVVTRRFLEGQMVMFFYDPKTKKKLKYYDRFPVTIIIGRSRGGFLGLNLHYLPQTLRLRFLNELLSHTKEFKEGERFTVNYEMLAGADSLRYFKPCIKRYYTKHITGNMARIPSSEWTIAAFLPTADFQKKSEAIVHRDSRKMI